MIKKEKTNLLYVLEERIPENLRRLVLSFIPKDEFMVRKMTYSETDSRKIKKLKWAEIVLFAPGRYLSDGILFHAGHIKLMQLWSSGYDKFNVLGASKFGIPVANNGGANASSVAEHAILLMLAISKRLPENHSRTTTGRWEGNSHGVDMFTIKGKTVGIVGFGNIGRQVAEKLKGFQADVIYYDVKRAPRGVEKKCKARFVPFAELLKTSDILTLHLHANEKTENLISAKEFAVMKKGAVLINVSRARIVNQEALYKALKRGNLRGAGLDVYLKEPTEPGDKILNLPNVVATPHMAGSTLDAYQAAMTNAVDNFRRVRAGKKPFWVVN